jgi:hypothetical protein
MLPIMMMVRTRMIVVNFGDLTTEMIMMTMTTTMMVVYFDAALDKAEKKMQNTIGW